MRSLYKKPGAFADSAYGAADHCEFYPLNCSADCPRPRHAQRWAQYQFTQRSLHALNRVKRIQGSAGPGFDLLLCRVSVECFGQIFKCL